MKTYNKLFDQICDPANIEKAILKASLGKRHKKSVQRALRKRKEIAAYLSEQLKTGQWRPIELHSAKVINDGVELKKRLIICPAFVREQVVHHAIFNVCAPLFQRKFYRYSCGSVPERGAEFAKKYIEKKVRRARAKTKYVCKLDVKKYFPTARPSVIFRELRRTIRDRRVLGLFARILRANKCQVLPEDASAAAGMSQIGTHNGKAVFKGGIPIGFYTSPWFANILLNALDHYVKEELQIPVYVRYMDDMVLFSPNKRALKKTGNCITEFLKRLCLKLKNVPAVHKFGDAPRCVTFAGYVFHRCKTALRSKAFLKAIRCVRRIGKKPEITGYDATKIMSYAGRFRQADARSAFRRYFLPAVSIKECRRAISLRSKRRSCKYAFV